MKRRNKMSDEGQAMIEEVAISPSNEGLYWFLVILLIVIVGLGVYSFWSSSNYEAFAKCLTEKGFVMYGSDSCPHCQGLKKEFGDSFKYVAYVNCDVVVCEGISAFPTWKVNNTSLIGTDLEDLSEISGCDFR